MISKHRTTVAAFFSEQDFAALNSADFSQLRHYYVRSLSISVPITTAVRKLSMQTAAERILVVDDDPLVLQIMLETLEYAGFEVLAASGGAEACRLVESPDHVALIVTDLNMSDVNGIAVAQWSRTYHPDIHVLFVSGRPDLLTPLAVPYRYLAKPFTVRQLTETVSELLDQPAD
jgi:CheY-like chemotaxis protein